MQARLWNAAHEVTVKKIAPDAIINDNYEFLYNLLCELASATDEEENVDNSIKRDGKDVSTKIIDWNLKGRVFYDFINVDMEIRQLVKKRDEKSIGYHIEKLRPQVKLMIKTKLQCMMLNILVNQSTIDLVKYC